MFLILWPIAIAFALADEIVVSRLLHFQYTNFHAEWERDGKPRGVFWIPEEAKIGRWFMTYASGHAGQLSRWRWLFATPGWVTQSESAPGRLVLHRIFLLGFLLFLISPFLIAAISQW